MKQASKNVIHDIKNITFLFLALPATTEQFQIRISSDNYEYRKPLQDEYPFPLQANKASANSEYVILKGLQQQVTHLSVSKNFLLLASNRFCNYNSQATNYYHRNKENNSF